MEDSEKRGRPGLIHYVSDVQASHTMHTELDLCNIKIQTRLFNIFGIWLQTDRQTYIHMHVRNAVMLVWGSLRLAPTSSQDMVD